MLRFIYLFVFSLLLTFTPVQAQETKTISVEKKEIELTQISKELKNIEKNIATNDMSKNESVQLIKQLSDYYTSLQTKRNTDAEKLENIQKQLTALGEVQEGSTELKEISKQRAQFTKESETVKAQISKTDLALTQIDSLNKQIAAIRTQGLLGNLMIKRNSVWDIKEVANTLLSFSKFLYHLLRYPLSWYTEQPPEIKAKTINSLFSLLAWAIGALIGAILLNVFVRKKLGYDQPIKNPNYSQKVQAGIFMIFARALVPAAIPVAFLAWSHQNPDFFNGQFGTLINIFAHYLIYLFLFTGLSSVLFTPKKTEWRLIEVSNERALKISRNLIASIYVLCFFSFLHVTAQQLNVGEDTVYAIKIINNIIKAACIILVSNSLLYDTKSLTDEEINSEEEVQGLSLSSKLSILIGFSACVVLGFSLFGYVKLAEYIFNRFFVSVGFIGLAYIFQKFIFVLFHQIMNKKFWNKNLRLTKNKITRIEYLFNFLTIPVVGVFVILCILAVWGVSVDIMIQNLKKVFVGFDIGGMHVSPSSIILGLVAFFITHNIFKIIKNSLSEGKLGEVFNMDVGIRTSMAALVGFGGTILALLVGLSVMGGSLKGLAIAAGALSLGAGLGLQNVVNNFVSGIILLFERPFKIGDWILVDQYEGIVKQINMRSTQIETFNKANVIIPNATLLSNSLINMTYKNKQARVDLLVGVDYNSDIELVKQTLLECTQDIKGILQVPNPYVAFMQLSDNSLDLRLSFYVADVGNKLSIQTNVYTNIVQKFRQRNINIPYPQRVLHVQKDETLKDTEIASD